MQWYIFKKLVTRLNYWMLSTCKFLCALGQKPLSSTSPSSTFFHRKICVSVAQWINKMRTTKEIFVDLRKMRFVCATFLPCCCNQCLRILVALKNTFIQLPLLFARLKDHERGCFSGRIFDIRCLWPLRDEDTFPMKIRLTSSSSKVMASPPNHTLHIFRQAECMNKQLENFRDQEITVGSSFTRNGVAIRLRWSVKGPGRLRTQTEPNKSRTIRMVVAEMIGEIQNPIKNILSFNFNSSTTKIFFTCSYNSFEQAWTLEGDLQTHSETMKNRARKIFRGRLKTTWGETLLRLGHGNDCNYSRCNRPRLRPPRDIPGPLVAALPLCRCKAPTARNVMAV